MKIAIIDDKTGEKNYVNVSIWSLLKANIATTLIILAIYYGLLGLLLAVLTLFF